VKRDLRAYARQTRVRLLAGLLLLAFVVGDGLILWLYGRQAALMGVICQLALFVPALLVVGILFLLDRVVKHANRD
jgi:uncharacterized SAM-binding protein YcdF (DUF218 family)